MSEPAPVPAPFDPDRFESTIPYYIAHRPRFPLRLLEQVLTQLGLEPRARVLDLGCGPGFLANDFAGLGCHCVAVDPSAGMLAAARAEADMRGVWVEYRFGSSYDLDAMDGAYDLAVMGRSFHWMDRVQTLRSLDRLVRSAGAVALLYDHHIRSAENAAITVADRVREKYGRMTTAAVARKPGPLVPDESVFLDSEFAQLVRLGLVERRTVSADDLVGRSLSTSFTSPDALGDRRAAFESELRARLIALRPDGMFTELIEFTALLARRPSP